MNINTTQEKLDKVYLNKYEKEKDNLLSIISGQENQIKELRSNIDDYVLKLKNMEIKMNDKNKEIEILKSQNKRNSLTEELLTNSLQNSELERQLNDKISELETLKKEKEVEKKKNKQTIEKLTRELSDAKDSINKYKEYKKKYEIVESKYKEFKESKVDEGLTKNQINLSLEEKVKEITQLQKENKLLHKQIDKLNNEILKDKKFIKKIEIQKKNLEYQVKDLNEEKINYKESNKNLLNDLKMKNEKNNEEDITGNAGATLDNLLDESKNKSLTSKKVRASFIIQNPIINPELDKEKDEFIKKIKVDKEKLTKEITNLELKVKKLQDEKDALKLQIQKDNMDKQKINLAIDRIKNEKKQFEEDNKALNIKIKDINLIKEKEKEQILMDLKEKNDIIEKVLDEKKEVLNNYSELQKEFELYKEKNPENKHNNNVNVEDKKDDNEGSVSNAIVLKLRNEIANLQMENLQINEKNRELQKKVDARQLTDEEINIKLADLDFYKKTYEEQKTRVNREHELISESLYKLAVHFMGIKDDLQKKMKK
jgi:chromosome segregation ATPase